MDSSVVSGLIGGIASIALCTYISKNVRNTKVEGQLKYGTFLAVLAWCCLLFVGLAIWEFIYDEDTWIRRSDLYSIIGLIFGFGFAAVYCFGEYFKVGGSFDAEGINFYTPWTGRKIEAWENLVSIKFNATANWYVLRFQSGNKVRLSSLLSGHGDVLELLHTKGHHF
ncbi:hypothetical protein [Microbulbifer aggregans]|uniref:hypothetical protein n=1 Tax=Microbulbifer aggregans TaxID=1769779 RepID=UPI001CFEE319|nr:hypothetical protein [Microbulbifer aggregans]